VTGVDRTSFILETASGERLTAAVDQIGDGTWGLFPDRIFLQPGETYVARLGDGICDPAGNCLEATVWQFRVQEANEPGAGDSGIPLGFVAGLREDPSAPAVQAVGAQDGRELVIAFTRPVMNVNQRTVSVTVAAQEAANGACQPTGSPIAGQLEPDSSSQRWRFVADDPLPRKPLCVTVATEVYGLNGTRLTYPFQGVVEAP
jgi:hypothetical protein